jgi:hypothetical protein
LQLEIKMIRRKRQNRFFIAVIFGLCKYIYFDKIPDSLIIFSKGDMKKRTNSFLKEKHVLQAFSFPCSVWNVFMVLQSGRVYFKSGCKA